ncbi:Ig-like domain-containing protein [Bacteroidales bacterium OttesenSCG-928-L03]|nr:Ig-like domain-containing protein [Bacteroidales bacterium OttesenSCG-928-L03]
MKKRKRFTRLAAMTLLSLATLCVCWTACDDEDPVIAVTGVSLDKTSITIDAGSEEILVATISPKGAANQNVTWSSSKTDIASVDASGKVKGLKAGSATITATTQDGGKTASCAVTVKATTVAVTGVSLNKTETSIAVDGEETLVPTITPKEATNQNISWSSSKTDIASVDAAGKVKGLKAGTATITVTTEDGGKTASCTVTVSANVVAVTGIVLNKTETTLDAGSEEILVPTITPKEATNQNISWSSSKTDIASVDAAGKVKGLKAGSATITVTTEDGGKTASCTVTVKDPFVAVESVALNKTTLELNTGASETLTAAITPDEATNKNLSWKSDKTDIASVDESGKVAGLKAGTATITVTTEDGGKTASCTVTVSDVEVENISLNKTAVTLKVGESEMLTVTFTPEDATNKKVVWSSGKESVVTVDNNGRVTAVGGGAAQVIATSEDGGKTAICLVTVIKPVASFSQGGIYYRAITDGDTDVEVTNKAYNLVFNEESYDSYSGTVNVPATVVHEGITYTVKQVGERAFWNSPSLTAVTLPEGMTNIGPQAFDSSTSLQSLSLPNSLEFIQRYAFYQCRELNSLYLSANVRSIDFNNTFLGCFKLEISLDPENKYFRLEDDALFSLSNGNLHYLCWVSVKKTGEYTIPDGIYYIASHATQYSKLTKINLPASIKIIGGHNFGYMENLTDVVLNWDNPSECSIEPRAATFYFADLIYSNITLHVPAGSKARYEAHNLWGMGFKIVEQ